MTGATTIGLLHPGEMGGGIGGALVRCGHTVLWASTGRSRSTAARAEAAGLVDAGDVKALVDRCDLLLSICPPHAAEEVAASVAGYGRIFVDANAVAPQTAARIAAVIEDGGGRYVDGSLIGAPPPEGRTRFYLSGPDAREVANLFEAGEGKEKEVNARVLEPSSLFAASALKMSFAAWSKGSSALLLGVRAVAQALGVDDELVAEWSETRPDLLRSSQQAAAQAATRGWRWDGEMLEVARTFTDSGLPDAFHQGAAEIYRRAPRRDQAGVDEQTLAEVAAGLLRGPGIPTEMID